jgi:nucleoside-diphosphate-sugar epimerase
MTKIDKSKPVMVSGATGYVAGWLVKKLLEEGLTVHAAVRNPDAKEKRSHLDKIAENSPGIIKYFKADLLEEGSYAEAMEGCELVYHTASPFTINVDNPQKELIEPAVNGTANVLEQANKTNSVKRVVVTSSCAAIYTDAIDTHNAPNGELTEEVWNTTASLEYQPYSYSKTLAEKKAWEIAETQNRWDMVTINPCAVMGPPLNPKTSKSESINILLQLGDGTLKTGAPKLGIGIVDVRDVAEAHYRAGYMPAASGRYITCGHNTNLLEVAQTLQPKYGESFPIPTKAAPKWLLMLIGPLINKSITRKFVRNNVNISWNANNSKIREELNMSFRPIRETMEDSFQSLIDQGVLSSK